MADLQASTESDSLSVAWSAPPLLFRNGVITKYDVICNYTDASGSEAIITNSVEGQTTEAMLYNLPDQTDCYLTVVPFTMVGPGPASETVLGVSQAPFNSGNKLMKIVFIVEMFLFPPHIPNIWISYSSTQTVEYLVIFKTTTYA